MTQRDFASKDLWFLRSASTGTELQRRLEPGVYLLGSGAGADITIHHPTVSRSHARLTIQPECVTIEDLGSTNSTKVDGRPIEGPMEVRDHAVLVCGAVHLVIESSRPPTRPDTPAAAGTDSSGSILLGANTVSFMRNAGREMSFKAGETIVRRGEEQDAFYVIIDGEVELLLQEGPSMARPLARLGQGAMFGAESVLGGRGAAVDAAAVTDVRLLRYPAEALPTALQESASLRRKLLGGISRHLHEATEEGLNLLKGTEVMARLALGDADAAEMITASARMRAVKKKLETADPSLRTILITGDEGTGRLLAARVMHAHSDRSSGPLIAVNCRGLEPGRAGDLIFGESLDSPLNPNLRGSGGIHLAHGGTLVLRGADALEPSVQDRLAQCIAGMHDGDSPSFPDTRVILTVRGSVGHHGRPADMEPSLFDAADDVIHLPPLADRPKDIIVLAEAFLRRHGPDAPALTEDAVHALLSMEFSRRNVAELRDVVDLAVRVADASEIRSEHILTGFGEEGLPGLNLNRTRLLRSLLAPRRTSLVRAGALIGFLGVIGLCLIWGATAIGRLANGAIWSAWEPVVFALFLLAGPVWCTICPLSTAARLAKRLLHLDRPPPPWIKRHGPWLSILGFLVIVWVERVFHVLVHPAASALLLAGLIVAAVGFAVVYQREVWCRHLCPLGRLADTLAPAAPLQLSASRRVCASTCTTHECYKGTDTIPGCTVFHHPLEGHEAHHCKLCLDCLKSCPHGSARLQLRPPLAAGWRLDSGATDLSMFALAVSLLALALVVTSASPRLGGPIGFTLAGLGAVGAGILVHHIGLRLAGSRDRAAVFVRISAAGMLAGWGVLMAVQLTHIPVLGDTRILFPAGSRIVEWMPAEVSALQLMQAAVVLFGVALALVSVKRVLRSSGFPAVISTTLAFLTFGGAALFSLFR